MKKKAKKPFRRSRARFSRPSKARHGKHGKRGRFLRKASKKAERKSSKSGKRAAAKPSGSSGVALKLRLGPGRKIGGRPEKAAGKAPAAGRLVSDRLPGKESKRFLGLGRPSAREIAQRAWGKVGGKGKDMGLSRAVTKRPSSDFKKPEGAGKNIEKMPKGFKKRVSLELKGFEQAHEESGAEPARVREQDEHVDFDHIRSEITEKLKSRKAGKGKQGRKSYVDAIMPTFRPSHGKLEMIKTGIRGLDDILGGGLPKESIVLLSGTCGTGKSIFGMNFLIEGAMKGEPGIYIALEESPESNMEQMKLFGWPVDELVRKKRLMILQPELYNFDALLTTIEDSIDRIKAKRLVIDAISIIGMYFEDPYKVRKSILQLGTLLKKMKCTTIAIDEVEEGETGLSAYGVEEFVVDGVIILYLIKRSNIYLRAAVIRKMRGVNHSTKIHPMEIKSPGGIVIYPSQELFEEIS